MAENSKGTPDIIENPGEFTTDGLFFLRAAQAAIRRECGWHVTPSWTHTIRVDGYGGGTLILPSSHVTDISGLEFDGIDHVDDIDWSEKGTVVLRHGTLPDRPGAIRVTLTDGWEPEDVPELHALMLSLAKRAATAPAPMIASQSTNGSSISYITNGGAPIGLQLFEAEKRQLDPYRLTWGARTA